MKNLITVAVIATLMGCAQTAPKPDVTHNWTATDQKLAKTFRMHNRHCAEKAHRISDYEACMTESGYVLLSQR